MGVVDLRLEGGKCGTDLVTNNSMALLRKALFRNADFFFAKHTVRRTASVLALRTWEN